MKISELKNSIKNIIREELSITQNELLSTQDLAGTPNDEHDMVYNLKNIHGNRKTFNIKSEDKAAFINRLEKVGVNVNNNQIIDDKLNRSFSISFNNLLDINLVNIILKQSPKIDQVKAP